MNTALPSSESLYNRSQPLLMNTANRIKVAYMLWPDGWMGGINYFRNLFAAIKTLDDPRIAPIVITSKKSADKLRPDFPATPFIAKSFLDRGTAGWFAAKAALKITSRDLLLHRLFERNGISALSHYIGRGIGKTNTTSIIGWIHDFQHVHLPHLFTNEELASRNLVFRMMCERCSAVILSSHNAQQDMARFAPKFSHKSRVLQFVSSPAWENAETPIGPLKEKYSFKGDYFLLPNQFWAHKNHRLVISALAILKSRKRMVQVLATGLNNDRRSSQFYSQLMEFAKQSDVLDRFRTLGVIPFSDLSTLMFNSVALLNPSRFEGWSTSVEEAKSIGKTVLLSDIAVHREQAPDHGKYFDPDDAEALADALWATERSFDKATDQANREVARGKFLGRQQNFARTYEDIVLGAIEGTGSSNRNHV